MHVCIVYSSFDSLATQSQHWFAQHQGMTLICIRGLAHSLSFFFFFLMFYFIFERQREREPEQGRGIEREAQNRKQAPGSEPSAQSPMWDSNSQTASSCMT